MKTLHLPLILLLLAAAKTARAEEPYFVDETALTPEDTETRPRPPAPTLDAFVYWRPQQKHYLRAALELETILIVGNVDYLLNTTARGGTLRPGDQRWDLRYDWPTFRDKLTGEDWKLDTNRFDTNYISHPFAGTLYYTAARSNRLSAFESFGYTVVGALGWEMFGELREEVSINDVVVTSSAGLAIGEAMTQLSAFFFRSRKNFRNDFLGTVFSPLKALNDSADGAAPVRSEHLDARGFTADEWHAFAAFGGTGLTRQSNRTFFDQRFGLELGVKNLPGYDGPERRTETFDDGNAARFGFATTFSEGRLADSTFHASAMPAGIYWRSGERDELGRVRGDGAIVGWATSFEYAVHDYDRQSHRPRDTMAILSPLGVAAEYSHQGGSLDLHSRAGIAGTFAGVRALAFDDYRAAHRGDETNLQTVLRQNHYYHALGVALFVSLELGYELLDAGGRVALDTFRGIEGFDEQQVTIAREVPLSDYRIDARGWFGARIPSLGLRFELAGVKRTRAGHIGEVASRRSDASVEATVQMLF